jgi:hypothetical protein
MPGPFIFTGTYAVPDGKLDVAKAALQDLTRHIEENEPRLHHFGCYLDEKTDTVTIVQVHPDSDSMELHLKVVWDHMQTAGDFLDLETGQQRVYGVPSDGLAQQLRAMGGDALRVAAPITGFNRIPAT